MRLYIGRTESEDYELGTNKAEFDQVLGFDPQSHLYRFCTVEIFEKITGLKLAPGEIRKVKSITIELE